MLRRINVVEIEETTDWYVEKDKSWNLAAAIWYVEKDKCGWKGEETTYWYVEKDTCCWKWRNNLMICLEG